MTALDLQSMVRSQILARGVSDKLVLRAMSRVDRREFVPAAEVDRALGDHPVAIGCGQTISQPYIVAFMTEALALTPEDRVLEIGTGCGYQTAILAEIAREVYTVEIIEELGLGAQSLLRKLGYENLRAYIGDGGNGWPESMAFDKIIVTAAPQQVPLPLLRQLKDNGLLVIPVGTDKQQLLRMRRVGETFEHNELLAVRFVPMTGSSVA